MEIDQFIADCREIVQGPEPVQGIRAAMAALVEHTDELTRTYPAPTDGKAVSGRSVELFEDDTISVMIVHAPPGVIQPPHDHMMSVVIGGFRGQEHQRLFRRVPSGPRPIEPSGTGVVGAGDVFSLGPQGIHAIEARGDSWSSAVHVYLGKLSTVDRSLFHPETFAEEPLSLRVYDTYCTTRD